MQDPLSPEPRSALSRDPAAPRTPPAHPGSGPGHRPAASL